MARPNDLVLKHFFCEKTLRDHLIRCHYELKIVFLAVITITLESRSGIMKAQGTTGLFVTSPE